MPDRRDLDLTGRELLDIGCGLGGPALALVREACAAHVVGIDIQQPLLDHAARRVCAAGLSDRIGLRHVEPGPLPFADERFDVIYATSVICHIADLTPFLAECRRVLRPDGYLIGTDWFTVPAGPSARRAFEAWARELADRGLDFHFAPLETFAECLRALGFVPVIEDTSRAAGDEARATLKRIRGRLRGRLVRILGEAGYHRFVAGGQSRIRALESNSPGPLPLSCESSLSVHRHPCMMGGVPG